MNSKISNILEWLVQREWQKMQERRLQKMFADGSYYKSFGNEAEKQWLKTRKL